MASRQPPGSSGPIFGRFLSQLYENVSPRNYVSLTVTGGGIQAVHWAFTAPGASSVMMESRVPYSFAALHDELDSEESVRNMKMKGQLCTKKKAITLAENSRKRAIQMLLKDNNDMNALRSVNIMGIACTASLATTRSKKGKHQCFVAAVNSTDVAVYNLVMASGLRTRIQEDTLCSKVVMKALYEHSVPGGMFDPLPPEEQVEEDLTEDESLSTEQYPLHAPRGGGSLDVLDLILDKEVGQAIFYLKGTGTLGRKDTAEESDGAAGLSSFEYFEDVRLPAESVVYPGSFNPLHRGHVALIEAVFSKRGYRREPAMGDEASGPLRSPSGETHPPVVFEIAAVNADKPPLPREEVLGRIRGLLSSPLLGEYGLDNVCVSVTSEPLFLQKAALFPECEFIVGADTMTRLLNPKYYGDRELLAEAEKKLPAERVRALREQSMVAALSTINERGCRFVVGGRAALNEDFVGCKDILMSEECQYLPLEVRNMFEGIDEKEFRVDLSSTELRMKQAWRDNLA